MMMQLINNQNSLSSTLNPFRSLICDNNGIVIAEQVYRCMFCATIFDSFNAIQLHYRSDHYEDPLALSSSSLQMFKQPKLNENSKEIVIDYDNDDFDNNIITFNNNNTNANHSIFNQDDDEDDVGTINSNDNSNENLNLSLELTSSTIPIKQPNQPCQQQSMKGGLVTCEVCGLTKYYSHISRRYGIFSCESCAKFFYRYSQNPVHYTCPKDGKCSLKINSPGLRCKSCLLNACLKKYNLNPKKHSKVFKKHFNDNSLDLTLLDGVPAPPSNKINLNQSQSLNENHVLKRKPSLSSENNNNNNGNLMKLSKCRRIACGKCKSCTADDCGKCLYCLDKPKFGGNDVKKQKCLQRRCLRLK